MDQIQHIRQQRGSRAPRRAAMLGLVALAVAACGSTANSGSSSGGGTSSSAATADPAVLQKALGTSSNVDPIVAAALARATQNIDASTLQKALACWKNNVCDTGRGTLTVALADGFGENTWRQVTHMEFVLQALTYPNIKKIIYTDARGSATQAIADMKSLIAQQVSAIVTFPDSGEALLPTVRQATKAGIVVVPYTSTVGGTAGTDYLSFVAEDLCSLGTQFADIDIAKLGSSGNVVMLGGTPGNSLSATWQGCSKKEFAAKAPNINIIGPADTNWTQQGTFTAMSAFLARYPKIDAVEYEYADGYLGGLRAYQEANRPLDQTLTLRTDEQGLFCQWAQLKNPNFSIYFSSGGSYQSRIALTAAMMKLSGSAVPARTTVPFKVRQVDSSFCKANLPAGTPASTVVPDSVLTAMFA